MHTVINYLPIVIDNHINTNKTGRKDGKTFCKQYNQMNRVDAIALRLTRHSRGPSQMLSQNRALHIITVFPLNQLHSIEIENSVVVERRA